MGILTFFTRSLSALDKETERAFATAWSVKSVEKGRRIATQGEPDHMEHIILDGRATSQISDPEGRGVCVGFSAGPCVVTPNVARTRNGTSLVSIDVLTDVLVAQMDSRALTELMLVSEPVRDWANGVLRKELGRRADREWCLAALGRSSRLVWFREKFPGYEQIFAHSLIASFLGMTSVTLSRLRGQERHR